jgi:hypothetical protein
MMYGVRVTMYGVRVMMYGVRVMMYGVRVMMYGVRVTMYGVRVTMYGVRVMMYGVRVMMFSTTFCYITVISWLSVFIDGGNRSIRRKLMSYRKSMTILFHIMLYQIHLATR